jgi:hypothetical protein
MSLARSRKKSYVENYFYRMAQPNNTISVHLISQYIIQSTMLK